jgi:hypothetical protein
VMDGKSRNVLLEFKQIYTSRNNLINVCRC